MSAKSFYDSNIFIYALDRTSSTRPDRARLLLSSLHTDNSPVISYQVVQEVINVGIRHFQPALRAADISELLDRLNRDFHIVPWSLELTRRAATLRDRFHFQWYDCLILAAALEAGCQTMYTEDLQHGQNIEGLQVVNPFR